MSKPREATKRTRLIIFGRDAETGLKTIWDLLELPGHLRFGECKHRLTRFNEHNPDLHLNWRETFRQMRHGELDYQIEHLA